MKNKANKNKNIIIDKEIYINIVNINDIEDIVLAKAQIDIDDENIEYRSKLQEFIDKYCNLDTILTNGTNIQLAFHISKIFGKNYLFCSYDSENEKNILISFLSKINYNINNLRKLNFKEMIDGNLEYTTTGDNLYLIKDNTYLI